MQLHHGVAGGKPSTMPDGQNVKMVNMLFNITLYCNTGMPLVHVYVLEYTYCEYRYAWYDGLLQCCMTLPTDTGKQTHHNNVLVRRCHASNAIPTMVVRNSTMELNRFHLHCVYVPGTPVLYTWYCNYGHHTWTSFPQPSVITVQLVWGVIGRCQVEDLTNKQNKKQSTANPTVVVD